MLADRDTFWIATEFLAIPSEMYPLEPVGQDGGWYNSVLHTWQDASGKSQTYATFAEVKSAIRHASFTPSRQQDVPFWISRLEAFISDDTPTSLHYRAIYEIAVASVHGLGTMEGQEDRLRQYFREIVEVANKSLHLGDLADAVVLVTYCLGAAKRHAVNLTLDEVAGWRNSLADDLNKQLGAAKSPGLKCELLHLLGYLTIMRELAGEPGVHPTAFEVWLEMAGLARDAPLFPLESFVDFFTKSLHVIGDHPDYGLLSGKLDELLAQRVGQFAVAEKARDRAIEFYKQSRILRAISELHQAKVKWFAEETLHGSILAVLFLAHCYSSLGLHYASKYYSMAGAWLSGRSSQDETNQLISRCLAQAAMSEYALGNWSGFIHMTDLAVRAHWLHVGDSIDPEVDADLDQLLVQVASVLSIAEAVDKAGLGGGVRENVSNWGGWGTEVYNLLPEASKMWEGKDAQTIMLTVREQIGALGFSDSSNRREAVWQALGITWRVHWINSLETSAAAEELVAALQVALTDFAHHDLLLLKTEISIEIGVGSVDFPDVKAEPSNEGRSWKVILPHGGIATEDFGDHQNEALLAVAVHVLREVSLLPNSEFMQLFEEVIKRGVMANILVARPYGSLYREMFPVDPVLIVDSDAPAITEQGSGAALHEHHELAWRQDVLPGYSAAEAQVAIARRYSTITAKIPVTIVRLSQSEEFMEVATTLRSEGWKDWHLLLAIANITWNYRARIAYGSTWSRFNSVDEMNQAYRSISDDLSAESTAPVPISEYAADKLREVLDITILSTLKQVGCELHQETPDFPAIREFVAWRLRYWDDDVPHDDPFAHPPNDSIRLPQADS